jgi:hypothetical protein
VKGNFDSGYLTLSTDGTKVGFASRSTNLDPADTENEWDAYVKDLTTGNITLVSTSDAGVNSNGIGTNAISGVVWLSADGTRAAFGSNATNLDPGDTESGFDIYVKDLTTGDIMLASTSDTGVKGNGWSTGAILSTDGTKVSFASQATNLDPADTDTTADVYVKDLNTGDVTLVSTSSAGVKGNDDSQGGFLSPDHTKVSFSTRSTNFDPADHDAILDGYVKNLVTGKLSLVSTSDAGVKGQNNSGASFFNADATKVIVASNADNLDLADDTSWDVFVKDLNTGDLTLVSASDNGVGGNDYSAGGWPSADLTKVAFTSLANNLDSADPAPDVLYDIYVKDVPSTPTSIAISGCSNGNVGTAFVVDIRSYGPRPLGCPTSLGGAAGNDYSDTTPILVGTNPTFTIDWATGPNSYGIAAAKAGPTSTQWRFRFAITASPGHDTPATNQYLPAAGSGFTKTRLQGKLDWSALDSFNCASGTVDPIGWVNLANNGTWVAKTS